VVASCQPVHLHTDMLVPRRVGDGPLPVRLRVEVHAEGGIKVQFGSDAPVEHQPAAELPRRDREANPAGEPKLVVPAERLTLAETSTPSTVAPAWTSRREAQLGRLRREK